MKFYAKERVRTDLYDRAILPYKPKGKDWLGMIKRGDIAFVEQLPSLSYEQLIDYLLTNRWVMTMSPLDDLFRSFDPKLNAELSLFGDTEDGLRVRPLGTRGLRKVSAHVGPYHGYLFDMSELVSSFDEIVPLLEDLESLGAHIDTFTTIASISRDILLSNCNKAFWGLKTIDPIHLIRAEAAYRLGRNEAFRIGTERDCSVLDIKSAYPYELMLLQACYPPYTRWEDNPIHDPSAEYSFYVVEEDILRSPVSLVSHRVGTIEGTRLFYPSSGKRIGVIGKAMMELRLRCGYVLDKDIKILAASHGYIDIEYRCFEKVILELIKRRDSRFGGFYKKVDTRITGCMNATYVETKRNGEVNKVALPVYAPIYCAAVVDRVMARIDELALQFPKDRLVGISIDGLQVIGGAEFPTEGKPGDIIRKHRGTVRRFTDVLSDKDGGTKWKDHLQEGSIVISRKRHTLVGTFGRSLAHPDRAAEEFRKMGAVDVKIPVGSTKRFNEERSGVNIERESYPTGDITVDELPLLCFNNEVVIEEDLDDKL